MSAQPLPSLFGRFTTIFRDHEELGGTLRRLRLMCAALEDGRASFPPELSPTVLLVTLRETLATHFAAEEAEQYFGTVLDESPTLEPQISELKREHGSMLRSVQRLCELAGDRTRWSHLPYPTRQLIGELECHERAESKLLRDLFVSG